MREGPNGVLFQEPVLRPESPYRAVCALQAETPPHCEQEEREYKINPCYACNRRVEHEIRRRDLGMEQPGRKVSVPQNLSGEDHAYDGEAPQYVYLVGPISHLP